MTDFFAYHNGEYKKLSQVSISYKDAGFQRSHGVFDYMRTYDGKLFQLSWHMRQIEKSIASAKIETNFSGSELELIAQELILKNKDLLLSDQDFGLKTIVTAGVDSVPTILMYPELLELDCAELQKEGVSLLLTEHKRSQADIKHLDYALMMKEQKSLAEHSCFEFLYSENDIVYECSTSNIFYVKDKVLHTPSYGIYKGSTREFVMSLAKNSNFDLVESELYIQDLFDADEVFITASKKEILPVVEIIDFEKNKRKFSIGEITRKLISDFHSEKRK